MTRQYYSSRKKPGGLTLEEIYWKLQNLYLMFRDADYFKEKAAITQNHLPDSIKHEAVVALNFQPFPITKWAHEDITEDHVFDALEFLYDHVSKPGTLIDMTSETGWNFQDYDGYDCGAGQQEFRGKVNSFLVNYKSGFELTEDGFVLAMGTQGLQYILDAEIIQYDEVNVDSKVRSAIAKWRNRHLSISEKKEAIRDLADVFEWLRKTKRLESVMDRKDEKAIFDIANNFAIRHHNPDQKRNYDPKIWYSWIFHFYLATYHAVIRMLTKTKRKIRV